MLRRPKSATRRWLYVAVAGIATGVANRRPATPASARGGDTLSRVEARSAGIGRSVPHAWAISQACRTISIADRDLACVSVKFAHANCRWIGPAKAWSLRVDPRPTGSRWQRHDRRSQGMRMAAFANRRCPAGRLELRSAPTGGSVDS